MSNEPPAVDAEALEAGVSDSQTIAETAPSRLAKFRASRWFQPRSKRFKLIVAASILLIGATAWWMNSNREPAAETPPPEPTAAERFTKLYADLRKSEETVARMDAFTMDDSMLQSLTELSHLTTVQVQVETVTPETIGKLAKMPKLEQLHLRKAPINDEMLSLLTASPTIWLLNLPDAKVSPEAIESLVTMPFLRQLRLGVKDGDNRYARAVAKLQRLRSVHLIGIGVTDDGLQALANMPQLESLYLDDSAVTESGWSWLFQNRPQLHVHIDQKHHDRDPQKH